MAPAHPRRFDRLLAETRVRNVVIFAAAISAGVHAALVPEHLRESAAAGGGFIAATVLLAALVVALTFRPSNELAVAGAAAVLGGPLVSYALAVTTGLPLLRPEREPVDGLALATKAIEAAGLLAALQLLRRSPLAVAANFPQPKGTLT